LKRHHEPNDQKKEGPGTQMIFRNARESTKNRRGGKAVNSIICRELRLEGKNKDVRVVESKGRQKQLGELQRKGFVGFSDWGCML